MLIGSYLGNLSDAHRTAVPKKFLIELGQKPILGKWYENCLILVSSEFWQSLLARLTGGLKVAGLGVRDLERFILGNAFEMEPDAQGRIVIPQLLTEYAKLKSDLVFVGLGDRVEIWSKDVWDEKSEELAKTTKEYIEELSRNERS